MDGQCAFFDIPSYWDRGRFSTVQTQRLRAPHRPDLKGISIVRTREAEDIHLMLQNEVQIDMDCTDYDPSGKTIFGVRVSCKRCSQEKRGFVLSAPRDRYSGCLVVTGPEQLESAEFDKTNAHKPNVFCDYNAEGELFTVRRFLCEYKDCSRFFVSAQVAYNRARSVVIEWGTQEGCGTVRECDGKNRKEIELPLCESSQCAKTGH